MTKATSSIRVLIVDDESPARDLLANLLSEIPGVAIVAKCANGVEAVEAIDVHEPDLVFLDIEMPGLDGFGVLAAANPGSPPLVIFVTAYDRHALRAFEVHAFDYILKPFDYDRIREALERARTRLSEGDEASFRLRLIGLLESTHAQAGRFDRIAVRTTGRVSFVKPEDILWVEADGNYVRLHTSRNVLLHRETLGAMEERLNSRHFVRVSRSAVVNLEFVREWQPLFHGDSVLVLVNGAKVQASRTYRDRLEQFFNRPMQTAKAKGRDSAVE
jgi:two-component system LytT family response regulator